MDVFAANPTRTFWLTRLKADRDHRVTFNCPLGSYEIIGAISFYDLQEFHLMTDEFHFMPS